MQEIFFISRSLDASTLDSCAVQTSSSAFELGIATALSRRTRVHIIHLGSEDRRTVVALNDLSVTSIRYRSVLGVARLLAVLVKKRMTRRPVIISTGYYLGEMVAILTACAFNGFSAFGYVYDTHEPALKKMAWGKRALAHLYFASGFFFAKRLNGMLVLNDQFIRKGGIAIRYLKTRVGVSPHLRSAMVPRQNEARARKIIAFAGTMNRENGTEVILDLLDREPHCDVEFHFYGDGDSAAQVDFRSKTDSRIKYFGRIPEVLLLQKLSSADYLINLRDPNGKSVDFAFPSKLVNFMATGVPVISNVFPGLDSDCAAHLIVIEYSAASLAKKLIALMQVDDTRSIGERAREYVLRIGDWDVIADEILRFVSFSSMARPSA